MQCLDKGFGGLKHYKYHSIGINLTSKKVIKEAIRIKLPIKRVEKVTKWVSVFNYNTMNFESVGNKAVKKK